MSLRPCQLAKNPHYTHRVVLSASALLILLTSIDTGIGLKILWSDTDLFEVRVSAWNGLFGGSADTYVAIGGLVELAQDLEGFPQNPSDKRKLQFGEFGSQSAGGAATMDFYCKDSAGLALVVSANRIRPSGQQSRSIRISCSGS